MLTVQAWTNFMKEKICDTTVTSVSVPVTMSLLSMREVASSMRKLRMFHAMNELESEIQNLYSIRASVSRTHLKPTHTPNTLLGNIDKWIKNVWSIVHHIFI